MYCLICPLRLGTRFGFLGFSVYSSRMSSLLWKCFTANESARRYAQTLTLSLYFFNLLPFPLLDGGQLLGVILDVIYPGEGGAGADSFELDDVDLERGGPGAGPEAIKRRRGIFASAFGYKPGRKDAIVNGVSWGAGILLAVITFDTIVSQ